MSLDAVAKTTRRVSVSTWALHPLLGIVAPGRPGDPEALMMKPHDGDGITTLLDVPAALAARGITTMELCHFHVTSRDEASLGELRGAIEAAGVELWSLLIDDGDLTDPVNGERDRQWIEGWIDTASHLGARCVRVIAGKQPLTPETLARSREQFMLLVVHAYLRGIHVLTENWFSVLSTPDAVNGLLESLNRSVGLTLDFGNWDSHADKYADLAAIALRATSCHAKCGFTEDGQPLADDYRRCLDVTREAGFSGPYTLVHNFPSRVWESIEAQKELLAPYCQ
jgi:hypothetical protein